MKFRIVLILLLLLNACIKKENESIPLVNFISDDAEVIVKLNDPVLFRNQLLNNDFITKIKKTKSYQEILTSLSAFDFINSKTEGILMLIPAADDTINFIYVTAYDSELVNTTHSTAKKIETLSYDKHSINLYEIDTSTFYTSQIGGNLIISSAQNELERILQNYSTPKTNGTFQKLLAAANTKSPASIFIKTAVNSSILNSLASEELNLVPSDFSDWIAVDLTLSQEYLHLKGVSLVKDSTQTVLNLFKNTNPLPNLSLGFAPNKSDAVTSYTFDDFQVFAANRKKYFEFDTDSVLNTTEEIGVVQINKQRGVLLKMYNSDSLVNYLENIRTATTDYQGSIIKTISKTDFLSSNFNPLIQNFSAQYYTLLEDVFVFAETETMLHTFINNFTNQNTFTTTALAKTAESVLAKESSILHLSNTKGAQNWADQNLDNAVGKDFKSLALKDYLFATQIVTASQFYHTNMIVQKSQKPAKNNLTTPLFTLQLDSDLVTDPQFVKNHRTNSKEIVVQDIDNFLYLISTKGKVLWKKQLEGKIQGKIHQVDLFKNGKLQLAFTTDNQFLIIDRNGKEVTPFEMRYEGGNLNPLAVFDYEKTKDYRFVVTQGSKVFMYNNKGAIVSGFTYTQAEAAIVHTPQHFRVGKKDFLVFMLENGSLKILNRVGNTRVKTANTYNFSANPVFLYKNTFAFTDTKGILYQIDTQGKAATTNYKLGKDHGFYTTSKTLALMDDNALTIKTKKLDLDLGVYTAPQIFYIYDTIYVAVTDLQNQKIYLYNSRGEIIQNFPVFGTSAIDLDDIDEDRKLELVVRDLDNSLIVYRIN